MEKNILVEKLRNTKIMYDNDDGDSKVFLLSNNGRINGTCAKTSEEAVPGSLDKSLQAGILRIFLNLYDKPTCMSLD